MIIYSRPLAHVRYDDETALQFTPNLINGAKPPIAVDDRPIFLKRSWKRSQAYAVEF